MPDLAKKINLLWITNMPAPYRQAIWSCMESEIEIKVVFNESINNHWHAKIDSNRSWEYRFLNKKIRYMGEYPLIANPFGTIKDIKQNDLILVNGIENTVFIASLIYARLKGKKSIIFYDSHYGSHRFKGAFARKIRFLILNLANFVVTAGPSSTKAVVTSGIRAHKVIELFNTVDVLKFYESASDLRQEDLSKHRYLYIGQFVRRKNILNLIIAFSKIKRPQDILKIVGTGELKSQMEKLIGDLNLSNSVFILGYKSPEEVLKIYADSDTLILPSTEEVWGLVANEALASGLHLVISRQCGATETIENMKGVYVCETGADSIAENMKQSCLDFKGRINDPEILQFTPEKFAKKLSELIISMENRSSADGLD